MLSQPTDSFKNMKFQNKTSLVVSAACLFSIFAARSVFGQPRRTAPPVPAQFRSRSIPKLLKGVTLEDLQAPAPDDAEGQRQYRNEIQPILDSLKQYANVNQCDTRSCLSTRIVFNFKSDYDLPHHAKKYLNAVNYQQLIAELHKPEINSVVLGELLDSDNLRDCDLNCFKKRVDNYLAVVGDAVDIWEVGNEVNGEWTCDIGKTIAKINYAAEQVKKRGGRTELTLYYNIGCREAGNEYELNQWLDDNAAKINASQIDYILLSYYENQCDDNAWRRPTNQEWQTVFDKIRSKFRPDVFIGFGEAGIGDNEDGTTPDVPPDKKKDLIKNYYQTVHNYFANNQQYQDKYIGGYYWWQFKVDMVPYSEDKSRLWQTLNDAWKNW
jgi:hypothetical protein